MRFIWFAGYVEPGQPKKVYVIETKAKDGTVDVLLGWDPPEGNKITSFKENDSGGSKDISLNFSCRTGLLLQNCIRKPERGRDWTSCADQRSM